MSRAFLKIKAANHVTKERKNSVLKISVINFQCLRKRSKYVLNIFGLNPSGNCCIVPNASIYRR